ncbi:Peptidoglycan recognition protein 3 [Fasciola hepatica]|uniref:Peptidoglycan-recognition protein n=1 Tax=Fasciola hepatica TaxID=6192 RepID=A0A4E0RJA2_FASHE|nr:Peptidoglycan recognition protein 3 [Fasciola hepatica]
MPACTPEPKTNEHPVLIITEQNSNGNTHTHNRTPMKLGIHLIFLTVIIYSKPTRISSCHQNYAVDLVNRAEWGALPSKKPFVNCSKPVVYVIIHHTVYPRECRGLNCRNSIRALQQYHFSAGYSDIGYNFLVGTDGIVYEGRGWGVAGAHTRGYNSVSCGIALIGNFDEDEPTNVALEQVKRLVGQGVQNQWIGTNYTVIGHRSFYNTRCPGNNLYTIITTWDHFGFL